MTYLSTQATSIQSITRTITWALRSHLDPVVQKAGEILFPQGVPPGVDLWAVCQGFIDLLQRSADEVAHRDREVSRERIEDDDARARRDRAAQDARGGLFAIRDAASSAFGPEALSTIGLSGRIPEHAEPVLALARNVAALLPGLATRERTNEFVQLDPDAAVVELTALSDTLSGALADVARDVRETQMSQGLRNEATARWRLHYGMVANLIESLLRAAGFHHVADRVRPTRRRRAGEAEPEDGLETQPPANDVPADEVVIPEPSLPAPADPV